MVLGYKAGKDRHKHNGVITVCCVGVCAGLRLRLCPAPLGWDVGVCVRSCVCPACSPPFLGDRLWCGGVRVLSWVGFAPPLPFGFLFYFILFFGGGVVACRVVALWCRSLVVPVLGLVLTVPQSPLVRAAPSCDFFFPPQRGVCPRIQGVPPPGGPLLPVWCCHFWLGGSPVPLRGGPVFAVVWMGGLAASCGVRGGCLGCGPFLCPPPFFFGGGVCLFLPLPSLGWCTHWSAFSVVFRVAVGAYVLPCLAPAQWIGWVMYTLGLASLPAGLGSCSAGWAVAPGDFVRPWVWDAWVLRVPSPLRCRY